MENRARNEVAATCACAARKRSAIVRPGFARMPEPSEFRRQGFIRSALKSSPSLWAHNTTAEIMRLARRSFYKDKDHEDSDSDIAASHHLGAWHSASLAAGGTGPAHT